MTTAKSGTLRWGRHLFCEGTPTHIAAAPVDPLESSLMEVTAIDIPVPPVRRVVIVHGYEASPDANWFPWLRNNLEAEGIAVTVVPLPTPDHPEKTAWEDAVSRILGLPDTATVIVAHSLGVVTALRVLAALPEPWELGGLVAVAGFTEPLQALPELDGFLATDVEVERLATSIRDRIVIRSNDDPFVPPAASDHLARRLDARLQVHPGAGHFMTENGVTSLPGLLDLVLSKRNAPRKKHAPRECLD